MLNLPHIAVLVAVASFLWACGAGSVANTDDTAGPTDTIAEDTAPELDAQTTDDTELTPADGGSGDTVEIEPAETSADDVSQDTNVATDAASDAAQPQDLVAVVSVTVSGSASTGYQLAVGISSDETGCDQYANWWEAVDASGTALLYRRILGHSHVNEQPFIRSGGPLDAAPDVVTVRAHGNVGGYGRQAMSVVLSTGVATPVTLAEGFGEALEALSPQTSGCAF